ncbi:amino acid adenylation domain-containing protein [Micromonospora sp. NPDC049366]|uniref:amino acid adenylation domain-containing protein n=1 Tax=Micromonospora sp. NPDC049366 TaxID=3364271 RepID=UPI00378C2181
MPARPTEYVFAASFAQEWIWLASRIGAQASAYNLRTPVLLPAGTDAEVLRAALTELTRRHEPLRTALRPGEGGLTQVVLSDLPIHLDETDLSDLAATERAARLAELTAADLATAFPLEQAPLWRARLVHRRPDRPALLFTAHHTIFDGSSTPILIREIEELCQARLDGRPARLPALDIQYADWAVWQRDQAGSAAAAADLAYWQERLADVPPVHGLLPDRPRPASTAFPGAEVTFAVPAPLGETLADVGARQGASTAMVLLAGYAALLHRLSGDPTVLVGMPVAGRDRPELAPMIGMFVNTLVLRIDVSGDPSFSELIGRVRETMLSAWEHQELPLPRLVEALNPPRLPGVQPLYQLGFNYLGDVGLSTSNGSAREELLLEISATEGRLEYRSDLFDAATAERIVARYLTLLHAGLAAAHRPVSALPLLPADERDLLVAGWAAGPPAPDPGTGVVDLILARAAATPDAVAIRDAGRSLTYRQLDEQSRRLAARLRALGAGPERLVGLALPRGTDVVVAMLAVLRAGAAYLPLEPAFPARRLADLMADTATEVVVSTAAIAETLPAGAYRLVRVDDPDDDPAPADHPPVTVHPTALAYVLHTSGSTGRPKGAMIEHRSLATHATWFAHRHGITPADRLLVIASPSFDVFGQEVYPALVAGATLVIAPPAGALDPAAVLDTIRTEQVTLLSSVPTVLRHLVTQPGFAAATATLRQVVCIGEQLDGDLAADLATARAVPLHNTYGPTETTIAVSAHTVSPGDARPGPVPIGVPMEGAQLYVLDERGEPLPVGVPGHLHIGGVPVGRGYLNRPVETAAAFVPDPFGAPGGRLYRTGDRCRWRSDGTLEFLERLDRQVKVNGVRVELGEIETALRAQPGVRQAAVAVRPDGSGGQRLIGYLTGDADPAALRTALRDTLPSPLVPTAFVHLDALPLMPSGKLDVKALPEPADTGDAAESFTAPRTGAEHLVATAWAEVLGVDAIGVHDNFFDHGGHSLLASRAVARIGGLLDLDIPIRLLFANPTVAELAVEVERLLVAHLDELSEDEAAALLATLER